MLFETTIVFFCLWEWQLAPQALSGLFCLLTGNIQCTAWYLLPVLGHVCGSWLSSYNRWYLAAYFFYLGELKLVQANIWFSCITSCHLSWSFLCQQTRDKEDDLVASLNIILWVQCRSISSLWSRILEQACFALPCFLNELECGRLCILAVLF